MAKRTTRKLRKDKIFLIFKKEFKELLHNKEILATLIIMPLLFAVLIPVSMIALRFIDPEDLSEENQLPEIFRNIVPNWDELNELQRMSLLQANIYLTFLIMIPMTVPMATSGDSIAGEKERRTIESLLAAPISEMELFLGKALAASAPVIVSSWLAEIVFIIFTDVILYDIMGSKLALPNTFAFLMFFLLIPTQTLLSTLIMTAISSRSKGSREAMQKGGLLTTPLILFVSAIVFIPLIIHPLLCLVSEGILIILTLVILKAAVKGFKREKLLSVGS